MITAFIFSLHLIFTLVIFTKKWQDESIGSAFQNIILIVILFAVGWSIATAIIKIFFDAKGLGIQFDSDTMSLSLLSIVEYFFYKFYYGKSDETIEAGTGK